MKKFFAASLLASSVLATPAQASEMRDLMGTLMTQPSAQDISAKCQSYVSAIELRRDALMGADGPATVDVTLDRFDEIGGLLLAGSGEFALYREVLLTQELRDAGAQCEVTLANLSSSISLSRPIFDRLSQIDASAANDDTRLYLSEILSGFERAGIALDDAGRARVQVIQEELAGLSTDIARNIAEDVRTIQVTPEELAGVPQDFLDAHPAGEDGRITLTTATPDYQPVMTYAENDDLRRRYSEVYAQRAWPENDALLSRMFTLRQELAELVGRKNYASLVLEDKMLNTPEKVEQLLADMSQAARPAAERDYAMNLAVLQELQPGAEEIQYWQTGWLAPKVQERSYGYNPQEARQYFAYDNVRDGILGLTQDLFQVEIREWDTPVWHEDVEAYEMVADGKVIGRFYFDSHPRPGKYTHANMIPIYPGVQGDEPPVGALVMNLPAGDHTTGLMEHSQVTTFLHEFGHMIHGMFGGTQQWFGQNILAIEWDFIEAPSQMLENWVYDYDTLANFAVNADGEVIQRELVESMNRARSFNQGLGDMTQLGYSNISLQFHQNPVPADLGAAARRWRDEYALVPAPDYVEMQAAFNHLDGYSAFYYTYRWSKVISDDLFQQFRTAGLRDQATALRYRDTVLARGSSRPAAELVHDFLGRDVSLDAYRATLEEDQ
ncbi:M3 family metallopeptidase [Alteraurantiacibacter aestuarii]|uniref:M3 family metallopeptidase n=1 Tax=Alteraurantiacibacter aestuarii TaxID=650004 RepID=UPI0031DBFD30